MKSNSLRKNGFIWVPILLLGMAAVAYGGFMSYVSDARYKAFQTEINQLQSKLDSQQKTPPAMLVGSPLPASVPSVFETYLSSQQGTSDTTLTLASGSLRDGTSLSGYQCFTIDSNTPSLEYECGTANGTSVTGITRGIDAVSGTSSVTALTFNHILGADVKITDYPSLTYLIRMANGSDTYDQPIFYKSTVATTTLGSNRNSIASVGLAQDLAFNGAGVIDATNAAKGVGFMATGLQAASSTYSVLTGARFLSAGISTSTYSATGPGLNVVVTQNNNKIDTNFLTGVILASSNNTFTGSNALSTSTGATTTIGAFPAYQIGMNQVVFSGAGTSTFAVPSGITKVKVRMVGGGGGGGGSNASAATCGGAGGAYFEGFVDLSATTSVIVFVGSGGAGGLGTPAAGSVGQWTTFGVNGFYASVNGGAGGAVNTCGGGATGAATTTPSSSLVNPGYFTQPGGDSSISISGNPSGGGSYFGGPSAGNPPAQVYGTGGSGRNNSGAGVPGAPGVIIINW